ncbi:hypothetical protein FGIG_11592 [Fasciola gigantica]|uniref:Uncharacterized protein n=1 Tax=Fasciola gigantica TaxID=46835 RepID=A0A504YYB2_FASGI|nr:hypothetical protein FGIG_11592 [Fasciola gigantica]
MFILQTLRLFVIYLSWINVDRTEIKITLWELKKRLEEFGQTTNQHITDFGNLLANSYEEKCLPTFAFTYG